MGTLLATARKCLCRVLINSYKIIISYIDINNFELGGAIWHPRCGPGPDGKMEVDGPLDGQVTNDSIN